MNTQEIQDILMSELSSIPINLRKVLKTHPELTIDELQTAAWGLIDRGIINLDGNWKLSIPQQVEQVVH